jgi:hypothetical protein
VFAATGACPCACMGRECDRAGQSHRFSIFLKNIYKNLLEEVLWFTKEEHD